MAFREAMVSPRTTSAVGPEPPQSLHNSMVRTDLHPPPACREAVMSAEGGPSKKVPRHVNSKLGSVASESAGGVHHRLESHSL